MRLRVVAVVVVGLGAVQLASAAESPIKVTDGKPYNLNADLSYLLNNTGNTDGSSTKSESLAGHIDFKRMMGEWGQQFYGEAVGSNSSDSDSHVERYLASGKMIHSEGTFYEFGKLQWEKDLSSAFDYQVDATVGVGKELYRDPVQFLTGEIGAGVRYSKEDAPPQQGHTDGIGTLSGHYERTLTKTTTFTEDMSYDYGSTSRTFRSRTGLSIAVTDRVSGLLSYDYKKIFSSEGDSYTALTSVGVKYVY